MMAKKKQQLTVDEVPLGDLVPSRHQNRAPVTQESLTPLADSIREQGVLEPILARRVEGGLEIIAGERRWRACGIAGLDTVPAIVREMDDQAAALATVTENMQREDLTPMEESSGVVTMLEVFGGDVEAVADRLRTSASWVARRARLSNLSRSWREAAVDYESVVSGWGASHLEVIARLHEDAQEDIYDSAFRYHMPARPTVAELQCRIGAYLQVIDEAPWPVDQEDLVESAPACSSCPHRSDRNPLLFGDVEESEKGARCLNSTCWGGKLDAYVRALIADLPEDGITVRSWSSGSDPDYVREARSSYQIERVPKKNGGVVCLWVNGDDVGTTFYGRPHRSSSGNVKSGPKTLAQRREALERRRWKRVSEGVSEVITSAESPLTGREDLLLLAVSVGTSTRSDYPGSGPWTVCEALGKRSSTTSWEVLDEISANEDSLTTAAWAMVRNILVSRCKYESHVKLDTLIEECRRVGGMIGDDVDARYAQAVEELPEPKSWANLRKDGTPRKRRGKKAG